MLAILTPLESSGPNVGVCEAQRNSRNSSLLNNLVSHSRPHVTVLHERYEVHT